MFMSLIKVRLVSVNSLLKARRLYKLSTKGWTGLHINESTKGKTDLSNYSTQHINESTKGKIDLS